MENLNITLLSTQELENYNGGAISLQTGSNATVAEIEIVPFGDPINRFDDLITENTTSDFETANTTGFNF
ncbi:hypothetical protein [uncultured Aquimarina sp.]|uniref:hypothetical protein n=1 Tax=uncultured Aquimarina sp. TaxID=575652 RepID=UPI00261B230D|nr:hypothetical protein [uncultured Aquimarina sp.]